MNIYENLIKELQNLYKAYEATNNENCHQAKIIAESADAIMELNNAAKAMHLWIFLNSGDEQKAYDECHLTEEMNIALGYGGQFVAIPKGDNNA